MDLMDLIIKEIDIEEITKQDYYKLLVNKRILVETSFIKEAILSKISYNLDANGVNESDILNYFLNLDIKTFFTKIYKCKDRYIITK